MTGTGVYDLLEGMTSNIIGGVEGADGNTESGVVTVDNDDALPSASSNASSSLISCKK